MLSYFIRAMSPPFLVKILCYTLRPCIRTLASSARKVLVYFILICIATLEITKCINIANSRLIGPGSQWAVQSINRHYKQSHESAWEQFDTDIQQLYSTTRCVNAGVVDAGLGGVMWIIHICISLFSGPDGRGLWLDSLLLDVSPPSMCDIFRHQHSAGHGSLKSIY